MKKLLMATLAGAMVLSLTACGGESAVVVPDKGSSSSDSVGNGESVTWKMGNQHNATQLATIIDKEIVEEVKEATEGRVIIELYTDSSLGDYTSVFDEVMLGTVQMAHITGVDTYDPSVNAAMLPYLMTDYDQCAVAYREDGPIFQHVSGVLDGLGVKLMGFFPEDFVGIFTMKELADPAAVGVDKGAVIRVPGTDVFALSTQDLGFRGSTIPYSDAYSAMQTGVVDGMDGNGCLATYTAFGDVCDYWYDYRHLAESTMIMISNDAWEGISAEDQEAISEIIMRKSMECGLRAQELEAEYMGKMEADGVEVTVFSDAEYTAFAESCRANVWPQLAQHYPDGFFDEVLADLEANMK